MFKVAAVTVLYNPDSKVSDNLLTYVNQVSKLFLVDNSDNRNASSLNEIILMNNVKYISNEKNLGIAAALNIGAKKALSEGYKYLLTMDQDSKASVNMVENLFGVIKSPNIGIVAAEHINSDFQAEPNRDEIHNVEVLYTMTSGNLLDLKAFKKVGGFLEELFIDHVDHEYCLRLNKNSFKVIKTNTAVIYHKVGNTVKKKFFHRYFYPSNHSPIRLYYRTRNRFYVDRIYKEIFPGYVKEDHKHFIREIIVMILYEHNLFDKFKMILVGYNHYKKNILGKYKR